MYVNAEGGPTYIKGRESKYAPANRRNEFTSPHAFPLCHST